MEIDPVLIIVVAGSVGGLWIERFFYYRSKYKKKNSNPHNPSSPVDYHNHEGRISSLETGMGNVEKANERDHGLIRGDILKLYNLFNRKIFSVLNGMKK